MKKKLLYLLAVAILIAFFNVVFFFIAELVGFGNNYSIITYLYMPMFALMGLLLLLLFLNIKWSSMVYAIINLGAILFLLLKNSLETHDLLDAFFLQDSRFCYVVINSIGNVFASETVITNILMYIIVFTGYYYLVFRSANLLVRLFLKSS